MHAKLRRRSTPTAPTSSFPEGMLKTMLPVGSGLFVKFAFQAAKKYPKECCQTRKDIEKRMCRVLAEQKGAK